jgi:NADPH-dependent curcumin reductase CurA
MSGFPRNSDMNVITSSIKLKVPEETPGILFKNLYLSCDPAMRGRMLILEGSYAESFKPGSSVTLLILHFIEYFSRKQSIQFRIGLLIYVILVKNFFFSFYPFCSILSFLS